MFINLAIAISMFLLPISEYPEVTPPQVVVTAFYPGANPKVIAETVATPLERHLASIASVTEMTSSSNVGSSTIVMQFDISRDIDGAARDVQAAINAARADLPAALRANPTYRKINPADQPIVILGMSSKSLTPGQIYDQASNIVQQKLSQIAGVGDVSLSGASLPAVRIDLNPRALFKYGIGLDSIDVVACRARGVVVTNTGSLIAAALLLGIVNAFVRPIVVVLTLTNHQGWLIDKLSLAVLAARVCQTTTHVGFVQTSRAVSIRFTFFTVQLIAMLWLRVSGWNWAQIWD